MKNKKKEKSYENNVKKFSLFFIMMILLIIAMCTYWMYAYQYRKIYLFDDDNLIDYKVSDYTLIDGNILYLKNVDDNINSNFVIEQRDVLNKGNVIDTDFIIGIYGSVLSVKIDYIIDNGNNSFEEVITLNVNLKNNTICDNKEIFDAFHISYQDIASDIFAEYIKFPNSDIDMVYDIVTGEKLSFSQFNSQSEKYIDRINDILPDIIDLYISNNKLYYVVKLSEVSTVCYDINDDIFIDKEIGEF